MTRPTLAITLGDPRGIGPEIVRAALATRAVASAADFRVLGPPGTGVDVTDAIGAWDEGVGEHAEASRSTAASRSAAADAERGARAGRLAGLAIERAVQLAQRGEVQGIVTAPIDKAALHAGGYDFPGHTEMLESLTGAPTVMMLASDKLRVVLATTHIALRDVPRALNPDRLTRTIRLTREGLQQSLGIAQPRIALAAFNPHAGDRGRFGDEDDTLLRPIAEREGVAGPFPADTAFVRAMRGEFDCVIAPYHDVGMTAIKVASFGKGVNITLGLPFPRTSPDHGTALDIAGKGMADASSFVEAIRVCLSIVLRRAP
ncbi:MAG: 4-hydroxythreonine-4-phosphate dehydrogenase PdxA [Gemmatimonadaceae bacterium]|nr:4-hydroxythreonine-4-phosphate dehydrogenase PdxA [Gemmatimonadaceae bacterium]